MTSLTFTLFIVLTAVFIVWYCCARFNNRASSVPTLDGSRQTLLGGNREEAIAAAQALCVSDISLNNCGAIRGTTAPGQFVWETPAGRLLLINVPTLKALLEKADLLSTKVQSCTAWGRIAAMSQKVIAIRHTTFFGSVTYKPIDIPQRFGCDISNPANINTHLKEPRAYG